MSDQNEQPGEEPQSREEHAQQPPREEQAQREHSQHDQPQQHGQPQPAPPRYGQPEYGQYGQPQQGQPQYGQAQYGQAQHGQYPQARPGQSNAYDWPAPAPSQYGQPQYGQPQYGQQGQYAYGPGVAGQNWNLFSILAIVFGFVVAPAGIVLGHISLHQIKRTGEQGRALAITGLVAGYVLTALWLLYIALIIVFIAFAASHGANSSYYPGA